MNWVSFNQPGGERHELTKPGQYFLRLFPGEAVPFEAVERSGKIMCRSDHFLFGFMFIDPSAEWFGPVSA